MVTCDCPRCGKHLSQQALIDSDDRIYGKWYWCACGYDTRYEPPEGYPIKVKVNTTEP